MTANGMVRPCSCPPPATEADMLRCTEVSRGMSLTGHWLPPLDHITMSVLTPKAAATPLTGPATKGQHSPYVSSCGQTDKEKEMPKAYQSQLYSF
jgi:hypothetical protein